MSQTLNPKDFIISRKRKKYRFAIFHNSPLCFESNEWDKSFKPDVLEIGAGNGRFSVELATRHPERHFVALDVKGDRLQNGARLAEERGLDNIRFVRARADQITDLFDEKSLSTIWLTFSDPFPKKRSSGRRLTHPTFLDKYAELLASHGSLCIKHDNQDFFEWSLEQLVSNRWTIQQLAFDLHESSLDVEYKIKTTYEQKWLNGENVKIKFVRLTKGLKL